VFRIDIGQPGSDGLKRELNCSFNSLTDHRSDESSTGYSFVSCSPAELILARTHGLDLAADVIERAFKKNQILHSAR